ncbi:hypothetical protein O181_003728 [Austropuccinia psidii MF-1]|uniref:Integrase catalytic domain-containing protein n=1 Tax=Austropuccinia psidii MF-1 TaxID=1389203 RepID=A0A9Q3BEZ4_9BASI|nr:hypothetical protein [Austropuccinia psidii MF-1]
MYWPLASQLPAHKGRRKSKSMTCLTWAILFALARNSRSPFANPFQPTLPKRMGFSGETTTLKIPIKNGSIIVEEVPFLTKISGTILSIGRLCRAGIVPIFSALLLLFLVCNVLVTTSFLNDCWCIDVVPGGGTIVLAAETSSPCLFEMNPVSLPQSTTSSSRKWHERLGNACDKVVLSFLKQHVPSFNVKSWQTFYCKLRSDAPTAILDTIKQLQVHTGVTPKALRADDAWEFTSAAFVDSLAKLWVAFYPSLPYSPQENSKAERLNQNLGDMARAMVTQSWMPMPLQALYITKFLTLGA